MSYCSTCGDGYKDKARQQESLREIAKLKARETSQAQAICKEEIDGTVFILSAAEAIRQHRLIVEIVSGRQD
jgi:hypothetical protein